MKTHLRRWARAAAISVIVAGVGPAFVPAPAGAAGTSTVPANPLLSPGVPQQPLIQTATQPQVVTQAPSSSTSSSGLSGGSAVAIGVGAVVILGGISLFIWRDARRRAPTRRRAEAATAGGSVPGSQRKPKPRKLSPQERRRRKRGRAR